MKLAAGIYIALATCMALLAEAPRLLPPLDLPPYRLQFSPDGHFLLAKSRRGRAVLLGSQTYLQYLECPADTHSFVRNGKSLLVWAWGKPARLYSPRDMSLQKTLGCDVLTYMSAAPAIAELPGIGLLVASESSDGRPIEGRSVLDVHELESGKVTKIRGLSGLGIRWLTFLDDGDFLVGMGSSADKAELLRWDRESEKLLWQIPFVHENFALGKDKRLAFAHFSGQSRGQPPVIIDVEAGKQLRCYPKAFVARMSPDGRVLATLESVRSSKKLFPGFELPEQLHVSRSSQDKRSWRGMIRLHDSQSMQELASFPISQTPFDFAWYLDGRTAIAAISRGGLSVWDVQKGRDLGLIAPPRPALTSPTIAANVPVLSYTRADHQMQFVDLATGTIRSFSPGSRGEKDWYYWRSATLNVDASRLACQHLEHITLWDTKAGKQLWQSRLKQWPHSDSTPKRSPFTFSTDDNALVHVSRWGIAVLDIGNGKRQKIFTPKDLQASLGDPKSVDWNKWGFYAVDISPDCRQAAIPINLERPAVVVLDILSGQMLHTFECRDAEEEARMSSARFHPTEPKVVAGVAAPYSGMGKEPSMIVEWDTRTGHMRAFPGPKSLGESIVSVSPDGRYVAEANLNSLGLFDLKSGAKLFETSYRHRVHAYFAPTFTPNSKVMIWLDGQHRLRLKPLQSKASNVGIYPIGDQNLALVSEDGYFRVTEGALNSFALRLHDRSFPMRQLSASMHRPDIVLKYTGSTPPAMLEALENVLAKQRAKHNQSGLPSSFPQLRINSKPEAIVQERLQEITLSAEGTEAPMVRIELTVNGSIGRPPCCPEEQDRGHYPSGAVTGSESDRDTRHRCLRWQLSDRVHQLQL